MLDNKRRRYGHPHEPFLIAAAVDSPGFDADDVEQVLYGLVVMQYYVNFPDAPAPEPPRWVRQRDGVWCGPKGPRAGRVSGVLAMRTVQPWTVLRHSPRLWLNPSAEHPLPSDFGLPLGRLGDGRNPQTIDRPLDLANLLGLPSDWPGPEPAYESRVVDEAESESGE